MTKPDRPSVALLVGAPAPYRTPFYNALAQQCRLLVAFETRTEAGREWTIDERGFDFEWKTLRMLNVAGRATNAMGEHRGVPVPLNVPTLLARFGPDVVISAELGARTATAAGYCLARRRPLIVWWEGTTRTEAAASARRVKLRRTLLRTARRAWANGEESAAALTAYGVPRAHIDLGMTGTDTDHWRRDTDAARRSARDSTRRELGLQGVALVVVGALSHRKGIRELLAALTLLAEEDVPEWSVLFVGSGPLAAEVEDWAARNPTVPLAATGFVQPETVPRYLAASDLFVMPSTEDVWGMVSLEAVVAGLPQVTSSLAGAASSIVTSPEIGAVADPRDARAFARTLADQIRRGPRPVPDARRDAAASYWSQSAMAERARASIDTAMRGRLS